MADSQKSMVTVVAIIAIVILVGIVVWFIREESEDSIEIDLGSAADTPAWTTASGSSAPDVPFVIA